MSQRQLGFLLQAKAHYDRARSQALPHFIILDEMNLAHVEYYFADFLSVLESGRDSEGYSVEAIQLHSQDPEQTFDSRGVTIPQSLRLPPNLYIIGTVNMDETTLMKVLPKFNGPRSRLRYPLEWVIAWAKNPNEPDSESISGQVKDALVCRQLISKSKLLGEFVYPETARKAARMLIRLHETGFASFA